MRKWTVLIFIGCVGIIGMGIFLFRYHRGYNESYVVTDENRVIPVKVADTPRQRERGLSGAKRLPEGSGMLFIFNGPGIYPFWMKEMNFPLDIIWMRKIGQEDYEVIHIESNVLPETYPKTFTSDSPADMVLEINAGNAENLNLDVGKMVGVKF